MSKSEDEKYSETSEYHCPCCDKKIFWQRQAIRYRELWKLAIETYKLREEMINALNMLIKKERKR